MCRNWEMKGKCRFGDECTFAHGKQQMLEKLHIP